LDPLSFHLISVHEQANCSFIFDFQKSKQRKEAVEEAFNSTFLHKNFKKEHLKPALSYKPGFNLAEYLTSFK
jgi:hypothetical protein